MLLDPIDSKWTIAQLLEWLGDESRQHDEALRHPLSLIEAALTGISWRATPSTVALIRSISDTARMSPSLRTVRISDLEGRRRSERSPLPPDVHLAEVRGRAKRAPQRTESNPQMA